MQNCAAIDVAEGIAALWNCLSKDDAQPLPDQLPVFAYRQTEKFFGTASQNYKNLVKRMNDNWDKCGDATKRCAAIIANAKELSKPAQDAVVQACREISENSCRLPLSSFGGKTEDLCSCLNDAILKASEAIDKIANANASKAAEIQKAANALGDKSTAELTRLKAEAEKRNEEIAARDKKIRELEEARLQKDKDKDNPALQQQQRDAQMERQRHQDQLASLKDASERQLKGVQDAAERRQQELAGRMQDVKEQARDARTGAGGGSGRGNGGGAEGDASRATQAAMQEMRQQQEQERMRQQQREDQERMRQQQQDMQRQQMAAQQDRAKEQQARLAQQNASAAQRSPGAAPGAVPSQQAAATNAAKSAASQTVSADPRQDRPPTQPAAVPNPNAGDDLAVVFPDGRVVQVVSTTVKYGLLQELDKKVNNAEAAYQGSPVVMPGTQIGPSELITGCVAKSTTTSLLVVATGSPTSGEPLLAVLDGGLVEFNPDSPRLKELGTDWKFWRPDKIADAMPVNQQAVPVDTTPDLVS